LWSRPSTTIFVSYSKLMNLASYPGLLAPAFVACSTKRQTLGREGLGTRLYEPTLHLIHLAPETTIELLATHQISVETPVTRGPQGSLRTGSNRACMRCSEAHMLQERFSWRLLPQEINSYNKHSQIALHNEHIQQSILRTFINPVLNGTASCDSASIHSW